MSDLIKKELIRIEDRANDWKDAIRIAAKSLLDNGYINEQYVEDMIKSVEDAGPYIVLAPNIAVPHARPNGNVAKMAISLTKLNEPVNFRNEEEDEDNWVRILFCLAAVDSSSHIVALQQLAVLLDSDEITDELINAKTEDEMLDIINKKLEEGNND